MNNTEYYERLGISKSASQDEIKKAYRKLSKQYHPDINKEAGAEDKYKEIQEAYETLGDEQKRAAYDQYGAAGANGGFGGGGGFGGFDGFSSGGFGGFDDIFSSFFGGGGAQSNPNAPRQGQDLQYRMKLKFEEAIFGIEKEIKYTRDQACHTCHGNGAKPGTQPVTCSKCGGRGQVQVARDTPLGRVMTTATCDVCHGTGKAGVNQGPYGDLYVVFDVAASDKFERDGSDIFYDMPLEFVQAALGDEVEVPTVHGNVKLKIPAGTQTGQNFRLRGKGAPKLRGTGNGDQHVIVNIVTPKKLNDAQKEALTAFAKASGQSVSAQKSEGFFDKLKKEFK